MDDSIINFLKNIQSENTILKEGLQQEADPTMPKTMATTKTVFNRTLLMPDSESAKQIAEDPKIAKIMHILDNFDRKVGG